MTTYVIYADSTDGYVMSKASTIGAVHSGTALTVNTTSSTATVGVDQGSSSVYVAWQYFVSFNTAVIPDTDLIVDAQMVMYNTGSTQQNARYSVQTVPFDFGTSVTTADWRTPTGIKSLGGTGGRHTQMLQSKGTNPVGFDYSGSDLLIGGISKTGFSRYIVHTNHQETGSNPGGRGSAHYYTSRGPADKRPRLIIKTISPTALTSVEYASTQINASTTVSIRSNGAANPTLSMGYSTVGSSAFVGIANIAVGTGSGQFDISANESAITLTHDPATGDIYVIGNDGPSTSGVRVERYKKGTGNSWTVSGKAVQSLPGYTGSLNGFDAQWVTGPKNFIVVSGSHVNGWSLDNEFTSSNGGVFMVTIDPTPVQQSKNNAMFLDSKMDPSWMQPLNLQTFALYSQPSIGWLGQSGSQHLFGYLANGRTRTVRTNLSGIFNTAVAEKVSKDPQWGQNGTTAIVPVSVSTFAAISPETVAGVAYLRVGFYNSGAVALGQALIPATLTASGAFLENWDAFYEPVSGVVRIYIVGTTATQIQYVDVSPTTFNYTTPVNATTTAAAAAAIRVPRDGKVDERRILVEATNAGTTSYSSFSAAADLAPTGSPVATTPNFDASSTSKYSWQFSDLNKADVQTAFQVNIERVSDSTVVYDSGKVTSSAQTITVPANTLVNDTDYRWRVRTYDFFGQVGAWSSYSLFSTTSAGTVTITDPGSDNQAGIETVNYRTYWSYAQSAGRTQSQYRVRVISTSDNSVLVDSGWVTSTNNFYDISGLTSNVQYRIEVTLINNSGVQSATATRLLTSFYANPMVPDATYTVGEGWLDLFIDNPDVTGDHPFTAYNEVWRRKVSVVENVTDTGSTLSAVPSDVEFVKVGTVTTNGTFRDYSVASGAYYEYYLVAVSTTGSTSQSDGNLVAPAPDLMGVWVHDPIDPDGTLRHYLYGFVGRAESIGVTAEAVQYVGRTYPVYETGQAEEMTVELEATIPFGPDQDDDVNWFRNAVRARRTLCYRDNRGRMVFVFLSSITITDTNVGTTVASTARVVDYLET